MNIPMEVNISLSKSKQEFKSAGIAWLRKFETTTANIEREESLSPTAMYEISLSELLASLTIK